MGINVKLPRLLQEEAQGVRLIEVRGRTVFECLKDLIHRHPRLEGRILDGEGRLLLQWMLYINDQGIARADELATPLKDGDTILLVPVAAGG
ncbi:MAG: MoaD/ThiS family protein [Desulfobacterales bacterium]|nr:MAG: MoaD/ThiS family protein [Desulfobacterales bacterium]